MTERLDSQSPADKSHLTCREALLLLLDQVDFINGACSFSDMVGACIPDGVIGKCRAAIAADVASAELHRAGRIPELEQTRINADYWLNEARGKNAEGRGDWLICAEQAVNAWKNAAYAAWDKLRSTESASGDRSNG
jgi:hypothetical protein